MDTLLEALINDEIASFKMESQDKHGRVIELTLFQNGDMLRRYLDILSIHRQCPGTFQQKLNSEIRNILEEFKKGV